MVAIHSRSRIFISRADKRLRHSVVLEGILPRWVMMGLVFRPKISKQRCKSRIRCRAILARCKNQTPPPPLPRQRMATAKRFPVCPCHPEHLRDVPNEYVEVDYGDCARTCASCERTYELAPDLRKHALQCNLSTSIQVKSHRVCVIQNYILDSTNTFQRTYMVISSHGWRGIRFRIRRKFRVLDFFPTLFSFIYTCIFSAQSFLLKPMHTCFVFAPNLTHLPCPQLKSVNITCSTNTKYMLTNHRMYRVR